MHPAESTRNSGITAHYSRNGDLSPALARLLEDRKLPVTSETLRAFDQFHTRGHRATSELADLTNLHSGQTLLDIGCGIGGPVRQAAHDHNVRAVGLDLTEAYCRAARRITDWLEPPVSARFLCGDATRQPFSDAAFDVIWLQHTGMNIADKPALYREIFRVLRSGGALGIHEITAGERQDVIYPTPGPSTRSNHTWSHPQYCEIS
ncbi:class I SAM-dependent methyltransferase [Fodinicurvata halophila]|uniref:class I SAM-dependent methyltransferase n=1 Tax=Fodinicurvata halophila TaxID=1419723 RepID=UPI00363E005E